VLCRFSILVWSLILFHQTTQAQMPEPQRSELIKKIRTEYSATENGLKAMENISKSVCHDPPQNSSCDKVTIFFSAKSPKKMVVEMKYPNGQWWSEEYFFRSDSLYFSFLYWGNNTDSVNQARVYFQDENVAQALWKSGTKKNINLLPSKQASFKEKSSWDTNFEQNYYYLVPRAHGYLKLFMNAK
jgi:hypothetical protein